MAKTKTRKNVWFGPMKRKSCPNCGAKGTVGQVRGWYYYHNAKRRLYAHFCDNCFEQKVRQPLLSHVAQNKCAVDFIGTELGQKLTALEQELITEEKKWD